MFQLLKLLQPAWYFNLHPQGGICYFPSAKKISGSGFILEKDSRFSPRAREAELAYRALRSGIVMGPDSTFSCDAWWNDLDLPVIDEYRFARKYFHPLRVFLVYCMRISALKNPFVETRAFITSLRIRRTGQIEPGKWYGDYGNYISPGIEKQCPVTVIIPTLNRYEYLKDVLHDLEGQEYKNFEVIVVDQSENVEEGFYKKFKLNLRLIRQKDKALWKARNTAIRESASPLLLFYDDDSRVDPDWISQHIKSLDYFDADISSGVSLSAAGAPIPSNYRFFRWSDQLDTGNVMIRREVFGRTGLFDTQFEKQRMGDGEFGLRAYLAGFRNISNPNAKRVHLKAGSGGLRSFGYWDAFRSGSLWNPRPVPSVLFLYRKYFGAKTARLMLLYNIPASIVPYRYKGRKIFIIPAFILSILLLPLILVQISRSWIISSGMLKKNGIQSIQA